MKQPKRLTREQKEIVAGHNMNPKEWMYIEESDMTITVYHKTKGIKKIIDKFKKLKRSPDYGKSKRTG